MFDFELTTLKGTPSFLGGADSPEFDHSALDRILSVLSPEAEDGQTSFLPPALALASPLAPPPFQAPSMPPPVDMGISSFMGAATPLASFPAIPPPVVPPTAALNESNSSVTLPVFPSTERNEALEVPQPAGDGLGDLHPKEKSPEAPHKPSTSLLSTRIPADVQKENVGKSGDPTFSESNITISPKDNVKEPQKNEVAPVRETPVGATPTGETPAKETPVGATPSVETLAGETSIQETPAVVKPTQPAALSVPELSKLLMTTTTASVTTTSVLTVTSLTKTTTSSSRPTNAIPAIRLADLSPKIRLLSPKAPGSSTASIFDLDNDDNPKLKKIDPELHPETPLTGTKKRGRKRKLETPTLKIKLKTPKPCDHSATDREEDDETKNLSRSFSSIKQRLKMLAKDMSTPSRRPQELPATPLTLKIKRSTDGNWSSNSTPPSTGKLILKISNGRSSVTTTPRIKVKPVVQQKAKTEALPRLKISLGGKRPRGRRSATPSRSDAQTPSRLGSTPKSSFYPEGWVSFDQVKPDLGKNKSSDQSEGRISKIVNTLEHKKTISEELITADVDVSFKKSTPVPEQKSVETKPDITSPITMKQNLEQNPSTVAGSLNKKISPVKPDPEKSPLVEGSENRLSLAVERKPEISERLPTAAVENRTKTASFKPKISLRTDLFEIKTESPSPSPKVKLSGVYILLKPYLPTPTQGFFFAELPSQFPFHNFRKSHLTVSLLFPHSHSLFSFSH